MKTNRITLKIILFLVIPAITLGQSSNPGDPALVTLPMYILTNFSGVSTPSKVTLNWELSSSLTLKNIVVEKSDTSNQFQAIGEFAITDENRRLFSFTDHDARHEIVYYRLKLLSGEKSKPEYSKVLVFHRDRDIPDQVFGVYPTAFKQDIAIRIKAEKTSRGIFRIINYAGHPVYNEAISLQSGNNTIMINRLSQLPAGNYIALLETGGCVISQKIVKRE